jgi:hypothetical protein
VLSLAQAARRRGAAGIPLPTVYSRLADATIHFHRSQLSLVIGPGGSGKSLLTANLLAAWSQQGIPSLAILLDQDQLTACSRMVATVTGEPFLRVKEKIEDYDEIMLGELGNIQACFKAEGIADIKLQLDAYMQRYGEPPQAMLVDNLGNLATGFEDEWAVLRALTLELDELAREYEIAILGCAHTSDWDRYDPPPRKMLLGKVSQFPRLILSVGYNPTTGCYKLAAVKNSSGKADLNATAPLVFSCDPVTMSVSQEPPAPRHPQLPALSHEAPRFPRRYDPPDPAKSIIERVREERVPILDLQPAATGFGGY